MGSKILDSAFHQEGHGHTENPFQRLFCVFESWLSRAASLKSASKQREVGICAGEALQPRTPSPAQQSSRAGTPLSHILSSQVRAPETGLEITQEARRAAHQRGRGHRCGRLGPEGPEQAKQSPFRRALTLQNRGSKAGRVLRSPTRRPADAGDAARLAGGQGEFRCLLRTPPVPLFGACSGAYESWQPFGSSAPGALQDGPTAFPLPTHLDGTAGSPWPPAAVPPRPSREAGTLDQDSQGLP